MKKMFYRLFLIIVAVGLILSSVACGDNDVDEPLDNIGDQSGYEDPVDGTQPGEPKEPDDGEQQGGNEPVGDDMPTPEVPIPQQPDGSDPEIPDPDVGEPDEDVNDTSGDAPVDDPVDDEPVDEPPVVQTKYPWENGGKVPSEYTWNEFLVLSTEYKEAFVSSFKTTDDYLAWLSKANASTQPESDLPWKNGGKQPVQYTWAEFLALSDEHKAAFVASFEQPSDYADWLTKAQNQLTPSTPTTPVDPTPSTPEEKMPWEKPGGKRPVDYTWAEYEALTPAQKAAFYATFSNINDFNVWMNNALGNTPPVVVIMPWEQPGAKQPAEYTWSEYNALTDKQKSAFFATFASANDFNSWMDNALNNAATIFLPWENGGKQPSEYTYAEYEALSDAQKEAFFDSFASASDFDAWLTKVQGTGSPEVVIPWENGGKQPSEYTYAEYDALSDALKDAFFNSFDSAEKFNEWLNNANGNGSSSGSGLPWENGGKQPSEYTYAEYEALSPDLKDAFFESFASPEAFDSWLMAAQGFGGPLPWENGGKQPSEYTWAEYEALSDYEKDAFFDSFGSVSAFDDWLNKAQGNSSVAGQLPWENGGKQPSEYTWAEYEALSDQLKDAFFDSFGSVSAFDDWLNKAQGNSSVIGQLPWENGGKQPSEYTWAEYEALPDPQKDAFFDSFGSIEEFDKWLTANMPNE